MEQLILHLFGDYVTQSDWMANGKTSKNLPALVHATVYTLPFILLTRSPLALFVMWITHFLIDRFRLAKYLVYAKNFIAPPSAVLCLDEIYDQKEYEYVFFGDIQSKYRWENCKATGYPSETPQFLAVWLMIIADNALHLTINYLSIKYL